ncbi:MAG: YHS domain-containing protein [Pseudonocardia sp.]
MAGQLWRTIAFVDLAGFTALTEAHGDELAADVAERLEGLARMALGPADSLVKTIGDAVMLAMPDPWSGITVVRRILEGCYETPGCPLARAGIHHGPVVSRGQDLFGSAVNLAARVTGQTAGGQVLSTELVAQRARARGLRVTNLGSFDLRNVTEPVELFDLLLHAPVTGGAVDPVCRMHVERDTAAGRLRYEGVNYWFCSLSCVAAFSERPERYKGVSAEAAPR